MKFLSAKQNNKQEGQVFQKEEEKLFIITDKTRSVGGRR
jgi:hypothetical protein